MKKNQLIRTIIGIGLIAMTWVSCESEDLYDPEAMRQRAKAAFGKEIDPNHNWELTSATTAVFSIEEDASSKYIFDIYANNPLSTDSPLLLVEKSVTTNTEGKAQTSVMFDLPSHLTHVYAVRTDSHGRRLVKYVEVTQNVAKIHFSTTSNTRALITDGDIPSEESPYSESEVNEMIANGYDLKNGLEYLNEWGGKQNITGFNQVALIKNNTNNSPTAVISTEFTESLSLYNGTSYFTKGENTYDWANKYLGYKMVEVPFTQDYGTIKVVIADGGNYTLRGGDITNMDFIVADGGTLYVDSKTTMNVYSRIIIMPGGKLIDNSNGNEYNPGLNHSLTTARIYNAGEMNLSYIYLANEAYLYNATSGVIYADGIFLNNGESTITNWGKIEADLIGNPNNPQGTLNNACLLRSDNISIYQINQAANTATETKNLKFSNATLRENSIFRAEKLNVATYAEASLYYAGSGAPALVSTLHVEYVNNFTVSGNIYIEVNTFETHESNRFEQMVMASGAMAVTKVGEAPVYIIPSYDGDNLERSECIGKGNKPVEDVEEPEETEDSYSFTYGFEDLHKSAGDYDMNDVVLKCSAVKDGKITVTLVAAGATKNLKLFFNNKLNGKTTELFGGREVHNILGVNGGTITNTIKVLADGTTPPIASPVSEEISVGDNFLYNDHGDFYIVDVDKQRPIHTPRFTTDFRSGDVPYAIMVPCDWRYPVEWTMVSDAYTLFDSWAADATQNINWYESGMVQENIY